MTKTMQLEIVSPKEAIFSGSIKKIIVTGSMGELGIYPGHCQLLTSLKPGQISITMENNKEEMFYISGGILEVQPKMATVLADTIFRANDLDEAIAIAVKAKAEQKLRERKSDIEYSLAIKELVEVSAQLRVIQMMRHKYMKNKKI
ncbi:F0F1 ATP synthase subunit epsilon [Coxiella endosymbiont of Amblyomma americanum]|uniref:F0F1 ATP synthase subunit epsilon n=1 Tax=Coxiella endosymbiont of Amblyomma americanum TaxID=325775 RepID=UPI00057DEC96|nr:F0F1 ATP synthase subunit epsilon [Coxiella endosymbiont of Amblyomma americanum]AJC50158.1 ATP synthase F0F1 subunit epsilon [Coxiella endosymbiont of Amblyomma americanum]